MPRGTVTAMLVVVALVTGASMLYPTVPASAVPSNVSHFAEPATSAAQPGIITRDGDRLFLDGQPYRFSGLNIYNANSDGWCWYAMDAPILENSLAEIGPGKNVFRAWFFQPLATTKGATPTRDWSRFDHTLQAADDAGMKVIVTLTDQWGECGSDQPNGYKDAAWYDSGYTEVQPGNLVSYRDWVQEVVTRYAGDPRVAFWQLINESEYGERQLDGTIGACPVGSDAPADALKAWATDVSTLVKTIDPDHLVSLGSIGNGQCGMQGPQYQAVHDIPTVDLCEYHDYGAPSDPLPGDQYNGFLVRINQCAALNKPLFVGEAGIIPNDVGGLDQRAAAFDAKRDAMFAAGAVGFLAWAWDKDGSLQDNYNIGPDDPSLDALALEGLQTLTVSEFSSPIDMAPTLNKAKAGRMLPFKFSVSDANGPVTDLTAATEMVEFHPCPAEPSLDPVEAYVSGSVGILLNYGDGTYQYNWKTPKTWAGFCAALTVDVGAGGTQTAEFKFTR